MTLSRLHLPLLLSLAQPTLYGCSDSDSPPTPEPAPDASVVDLGFPDSGSVGDLGFEDAGVGDLGVETDGGETTDLGATDAGTVDTGPGDVAVGVDQGGGGPDAAPYVYDCQDWATCGQAPFDCVDWDACGGSTVVYEQDFEAGFDGWSIDGGVWALGAPTATFGPSAHGGSAVAGTVLGGGYPQGNAGAYLVSRELTVPAANLNPTMRFWTWSHFRPAHLGIIQIRDVGTGGWVELDRVTGENAQWVQSRYSLRDWAERTIQVRFRLYNFGGLSTPTRAGYYVDDFTIETGPASMGAVEDFDSGYGDWSVEGGVWEIGAPTDPNGPQPRSGNALAGTVLEGGYPQGNAESYLVSPDFLVPPAPQHPVVRFWTWSHLRDGHIGIILIREVGGRWTELARLTGDNAQWTQTLFSLETWAERRIQIGFRLYNFGGSPTPERPGFFVDDFSVETGDSAFNSPEGFEMGWGDWSAEGGVWDIGAPTSMNGPSSPFMGMSVAGTVLDGPYPFGNADAYFVSPAFFVPPVGERPSIRLRSWSRFRNGHFGVLLLRSVAGRWVEHSRILGDNPSWVQTRIPLDAWAEQRIQFGVRLYNFGGGTSQPDRAGFFLDSFALENRPSTFAGVEDFEGGYGDWSVEGGYWAIGAPTASNGPTPRSGQGVAGTVLDGNYPNGNATHYLVSPEMTVPALSLNPAIEYYMWYHLNQSHLAIVQVRDVAFPNWTEVGRVSGDGRNWTRFEIDLSNWAERTIEVRYVLYNFGGGTLPRAGIYIDDFQLTTN